MKKILILLILISNSLNAQMNDESKHFYAGFGITLGTHWIASQFDIKPVYARAIGFATGMIANGTKEIIHDKWLGLGVPSLKDGGFTTYGCVLGTGVAFCIDDTKKTKLLKLDTLYFSNLNQK